jgi:hypothetical protein
MALLVSVTTARTRLGLPDKKDINDKLSLTIEQASEVVADGIRDTLERADVVDIFYVKRSLEFGNTIRRRGSVASTGLEGSGQSSQTPLHLSRGFVDSISSVRAANTVVGLEDSALYTDLKSPTDYASLVNLERGELRISDFTLSEAYVRVAYKAGFLTNSGNPALYLNVPNWLKQATLFAVEQLANANPTLRVKEVTQEETDTLSKKVSIILNNRARYMPMAWEPLSITSTASST